MYILLLCLPMYHVEHMLESTCLVQKTNGVQERRVDIGLLFKQRA